MILKDPTKVPGLSRLLIATGNEGKAREIARILHGLDIEIVDLRSLGRIDSVEETGSTFAENAELKAAGYASSAGLFTLADDSGLEVAELGGRPGVFSARYGGSHLSDRERSELLLGEMSAIPSGRRNARFVAAVSLADPSGKIVRTFHGSCYGSIADAPRGEHGFGYDPIFVPENWRRTFGELPDEIKSSLSHRSRALSKLIEFLPDFTGV